MWKWTWKPISTDLRHATLSGFHDRPHKFRSSNYFNHHKHKNISIQCWNWKLWLPEQKAMHHKKCVLEEKIWKKCMFMCLTHRLNKNQHLSDSLLPCHFRESIRFFRKSVNACTLGSRLSFSPSNLAIVVHKHTSPRTFLNWGWLTRVVNHLFTFPKGSLKLGSNTCKHSQKNNTTVIKGF